MKSLSAISAKLLRLDWLVAPLLLLASALLLLLIYLQYNHPGKWMSNIAPLSWSGEALTLAKGQGHKDKGKLVIEGLLEQGMAVVTLSPPVFRAEDYRYANWTITGAVSGVQMEFLWRTAENRTFSLPLVWVGNTLLPLRIAEDVNWRGQIVGLALVIKGQLTAPVLLGSISLQPASARGELTNMLERWFALDGWRGTSEHFLDEGAIDQDVPFVLAIAALLMLALALYLILAKIEILPLNLAVVWGMVFSGWFMLDARWQSNLFRQLDLTRQQFAGKSWEGKHLAAEDGRLFDLMQQIKAKLSPSGSRVFLFADDAYTGGRGAYHLLPLNALKSRDLFSAGQFKSGDFIIILGKDEVEFDPSLNLLKWEPQQQLRADLLLLAANNVLLRVR